MLATCYSHSYFRLAVPFGLSTAISSNRNTFTCDSILRSLISRIAVTGNCTPPISRATCLTKYSSYSIFLVVHQHFLQCNYRARLLRFGFIDFAVLRNPLAMARLQRSWKPRSDIALDEILIVVALRCKHIPESALSQLIENFILIDRRATMESSSIAALITLQRCTGHLESLEQLRIVFESPCSPRRRGICGILMFEYRKRMRWIAHVRGWQAKSQRSHGDEDDCKEGERY